MRSEVLNSDYDLRILHSLGLGILECSPNTHKNYIITNTGGGKVTYQTLISYSLATTSLIKSTRFAFFNGPIASLSLSENSKQVTTTSA